jgi:formate/nitrite transporter FocA (FNT family)
LGRQALFTESTLTAVLPILVRRNRKTLLLTVRFWAVVLSTNLVGSYIFAALVGIPGVFSADVSRSLMAIATQAVSGDFWPTLVKAILAGWLIAVMVWLLPSARTAKIFVVMLLTYIVGIGQFSHIIAGSIDSAYAVIWGQAHVSDYVLKFLIPTLIGNTIGGVGMAALLNHAPLVEDLEGAHDHGAHR